MIVDDSTHSRKMNAVALKPFLKDDDQLIYATNGAEAVEKFDEFYPDVIFMDLTMPVMDGFEASERILQKAKEDDSRVIIIVISADVQQKTRDRLKEIGVKMFIKKPISTEAIRVVFERIIKGLKDG